MAFAAAFPTDSGDYHRLAGLAEHTGQFVFGDRSVILPKENGSSGAGWRLGFLGSLYCSVFQNRLPQKHGASIMTEPAV
ncbi:hypothetical protein PG989_006382 [Apiospora arundinis]